MLAYSEEGKLEEYEDVNGDTICSFCLKIYRQTLNEQLSGFREREEDICPYCDYVNDSSMKYDYWNTAINDVELKALKKKRNVAGSTRSRRRSNSWLNNSNG